MPDVSRSLKVGDRAPLFRLPSSTGKPVDLTDYLARGPVVVAWYLFDFGRI
jgi:peroxiredoxin